MTIAAVYENIVSYLDCEESSGYRYNVHNGYCPLKVKVVTGTDRNAVGVKGNCFDMYEQWTPGSNVGICLHTQEYTNGGQWFKPPDNMSFSQSFWMKAATTLGTGTQITMSCYFEGYPSAGPFGAWYFNWNTDGKLSFSTINKAGSTNTLTTAVSQNTARGSWHYYTITYNVTTGAKRILVDSVEVASGTGSTTLWRTSPYGRDYNGAYTIGGYLSNGSLQQANPSSYDEIIYTYNYVFTDDDITWLYNSGNGRSYSELANYNKMNSLRS